MGENKKVLSFRIGEMEDGMLSRLAKETGLAGMSKGQILNYLIRKEWERRINEIDYYNKLIRDIGKQRRKEQKKNA